MKKTKTNLHSKWCATVLTSYFCNGKKLFSNVYVNEDTKHLSPFESKLPKNLITKYAKYQKSTVQKLIIHFKSTQKLELLFIWFLNIFDTRKHSSRMRTVCCSGRRRVGCLPRGCVCPGGVCLGRCLPGGVCLGGVWLGVRVCLGGVCLGGCLSGGGGVCPGGVVSQHALGKTPPCGQNDRRLWKYYLAATTLRTVKITICRSNFARFMKQFMQKVTMIQSRSVKLTQQTSDARFWTLSLWQYLSLLYCCRPSFLNVHSFRGKRLKSWSCAPPPPLTFWTPSTELHSKLTTLVLIPHDN